MLILSLAGILVSLLLARIHFKANTEAGFRSFCGGSTFNCDDVARSPYAILLGVPTAWWGIWGYLIAAAVASLGLRTRRPALIAACGLLLFTGFVALSAVLGFISAFRLRALCILCATTYGINLLLFVLALVQALVLGFSDVLASLPRQFRQAPGKTQRFLSCWVPPRWLWWRWFRPTGSRVRDTPARRLHSLAWPAAKPLAAATGSGRRIPR